MTNNDILRRIRYTFDFDDSKMISIFALADYEVTRGQISDWLKKDDDPAYQECSDTQFAIFLNGLINDRRGKRDGPQPEPEKRLNNNIIFMKLKIALNLKAEDVLELIDLTDLKISKHELSAFFRKSDHKHYRACKDQVLRNFLKGIQLKYRSEIEAELEAELEIETKKELEKKAKKDLEKKAKKELEALSKPKPRSDSRSKPRPGARSKPRPGAGSKPRPGAGSKPRPGAGSKPRPGAGSKSESDSKSGSGFKWE